MSAEALDENIEFHTKARWAIPQRLDAMAFIGPDVLAVAHDVYILFLDFKHNTEMVYVANNKTVGDGVDVIAGHRSTMFAFAEKVRNPRIFILTFPSMLIMTELRDLDVNRYKGLCMMEGDLVCGFSGFPNYVVTVWSWRTAQRLLCLETGVTRRSQLYVASRMGLMVCECWGAGLIVWEVAQCYKLNLMMKRPKEEVSGWEVSEPPLVGICWSNDGQLYAIDENARLYSVLSDGINMVTNLEWSEDDIEVIHKPYICSFGNGLLIYGPDNLVRSLKKCESQWKVVWTYEPADTVLRLVSNAVGTAASLWTKTGMVYKMTGESEEKIDVELVTFKQRGIQKIQLIAPDFKYLATMNHVGVLCIYDVYSTKLMVMKYVEGNDISFQASPVEPLIIIFGEVGPNYGMVLMTYDPDNGFTKVGGMCLTHQIVSQVQFSPTGREVVAVAMSAGHVFMLALSEDYKLTLIRYMEVGRGIADCFLMPVNNVIRCFILVLFSDKFLIGERIVVVNTETGKDNKFAGKMQGPYARLLPLGTKDTMLGIPHLSRQYHVLKLAADKGVTISVKMGPIVDTGHEVKYFNGFFAPNALLTFGYDGTIVLRQPDGRSEIDLQLAVTHRYENGIQQAVIDSETKYIVHLAASHTMVVHCLRGKSPEARQEPKLEAPDQKLFDKTSNGLTIIALGEKNYLDRQEDKKVHEEAMDYKKQRDEVVTAFNAQRAQLVELLEENIAEIPLHQLSLAEFNLHAEHKKERLKQAEQERLIIRLNTEARIAAQDKVTLWIKKYCWDTMMTPRAKILAIFSHYQVENYAVLPTQRDNWPELQQVGALRALEMENDEDLFKPWEEHKPEPSAIELLPTVMSGIREKSTLSVRSARALSGGTDSQFLEDLETEEEAVDQYCLAGTAAHKFITVPGYMIPQTRAYSFLQMNWLQQIVKLNVQNMRLWFNKQFDELMAAKKREVGLVCERNARLRFIIDELNKLSDLRGSFHHLVIQIKDPQWAQDEQPERLIKVDPEECSIEPYISPSQIVIPPPEGGPKDDFRERALIEMMDGVLEKLWHEEIKKPIPMPQCMLDKDPEHFNEDDLRVVFEYEAKVAFRNEERDKYRKMLHAEYAKLSQVLNEGVVKFNAKVKDTWLLKLKVDSVIGQENLNLMRLRRANLDRVEMAEKIEHLRAEIAKSSAEEESLMEQLQQIQEQGTEVQAAYDALAQKDKYLERSFKNHFADLSPIIVDQCYKFFKKRPKWHMRATMTPVVLYGLAHAVLAGVRPARLHPDCFDFFKGVEVLDQISNMPPVMDEGLWATMVKLRRVKIENEIRMRAVGQEMAYVDNSNAIWTKSILARKNFLIKTQDLITEQREEAEHIARNRVVQFVLPAGQVEIPTTGHMEDYHDATLIPREDIEKINEVILAVGELKLRMMRKQMEFRKGILAKEWEHAQMKMKLRHMEQELASYRRLKIPKELQLYLKNKELGYTDEQDYLRLEKEMEAEKQAVNRVLEMQIQRVEELQVKINAIEAKSNKQVTMITTLNAQVSEKRLNEDPLEPIRTRRILKKRMEMLVQRSQLIREVQHYHSDIVLLQTELELLRLKTYPTLASFRTID
ncbi:LOW QUALITY PROTEIN: cilia- and flagella-associated protein 43 [Cydia pomonella]|uniref:LOW QUALITY PROTEIN: cilia- and flagella-associated protein 43 n=1 Tax=Cydia pomonella TaxID=82600 RepID=UPI002ADD6720|nr:LOW QUALITY PROTEIN: cilia- and flagella-associated protein 43 [Cydia pomonella]